eukprot:1159662-Pelagomonas_calceolata.AAC.4
MISACPFSSSSNALDRPSSSSRPRSSPPPLCFPSSPPICSSVFRASCVSPPLPAAAPRGPQPLGSKARSLRYGCVRPGVLSCSSRSVVPRA